MKYKLIENNQLEKQPKIGDSTIQIGTGIVFGRNEKYWAGTVSEITELSRDRIIYTVENAISEDDEKMETVDVYYKDVSEIIIE